MPTTENKMKLVSNTLFGKSVKNGDFDDYAKAIQLPPESSCQIKLRFRENYDELLSQPLELWMLVPCDKDGNVLNEPKERDFYTPMPDRDGNKVWNTNKGKFEAARKEYHAAKSRVLFEGFELRCPNAVTDGRISITFTKSGGILLDKVCQDHFENIKTITKIDDLAGYDLTLTETAKNQIFK